MESIPEHLETLLRSLASDALKEDKKSKRVRHSSGQIMRLPLDAKRTEQGYRGADVFVGPSRTEEAYVAAVLALHGEVVERKGDKKNRQSDKMARARKAILFFELMRSGRTDGAARDTVYQAMKDLRLYKESPLKATDFFSAAAMITTLLCLRRISQFDMAVYYAYIRHAVKRHRRNSWRRREISVTFGVAPAK